MVQRDWDFMSHGIYNTRYLNTYSEEQEREFYRDCIETLQRKKHKATGASLVVNKAEAELVNLIYASYGGNEPQPAYQMAERTGIPATLQISTTEGKIRPPRTHPIAFGAR